jgi:hypothetical protein
MGGAECPKSVGARRGLQASGVGWLAQRRWSGIWMRNLPVVTFTGFLPGPSVSLQVKAPSIQCILRRPSGAPSLLTVLEEQRRGPAFFRGVSETPQL